MNFPPTCREGEETLKRELLNLLVWAMPALTVSEDEASTELHKEHHSRSAGLNQRLAEAERDEWGGMIERAHKKQQDEEERKNTNSNQLEDKEQAYLRKVNRAMFKANNGCLRAAKQNMLGEHASFYRRRNDKDDSGKNYQEMT